MHYFCSSSGWLYPPEGEGKNQRKWGAPGSLTRISAFNKIRERHVSLISARCLRVSIPMQIIHDDSAESGEPKPGDEEYKLTISGTAILFNAPNKGECCRGVSNSPRQPERKRWQITTPKSLARACKLLSLSLQETVLLQGERTSTKNSHKKKGYSLKIEENWDFISFHISIFMVYMMLALECKSWSV